MHGYQLTFVTRQDRQHDGMPVAEWLLEQARERGLGGTTISAGIAGFGRDGLVRADRFFDLGEQPVAVVMALSDHEAEDMLEAVRGAGLSIFYMKVPAEFGLTRMA